VRSEARALADWEAEQRKNATAVPAEKKDQ
jgi:hypothetical protein